MLRHFSNVVGFDDAPFPDHPPGNVPVVGTVYARLQLNGILIGAVRKDGIDAADKLIEMISRSKFAEAIQLILLQGIALAGFNVVDVFRMHEQLKFPVLVVSRKQPEMDKIKDALRKMPDGLKKWGLLERLGPMEPIANVHVQRVGLTVGQAEAVIRQFTVTGHIPEPLRVAHMIAGAMITGQSSGRV